MPGRRESSSTTLVTGRAVIDTLMISAQSGAERAGKRALSRKPGQSQSAKPAGRRSELLLRQLLRLALGVVQRCHDRILQRLHVLGVDELSVDPEALHLLMAVHHHHDGAAPRAAFD